MPADVDSPQIADDAWSRWLLSRDGGSASYHRILRDHLEQMRDRILDAAGLCEGITLLDLGAGDGLLGLGAIDRIGPSLRAIFTDISAPILRHVQRVADDRGIAAQCSFHTCTAEHQDELWDASVDVVVSRAALAFVANKHAALCEIFRVLKPGGRLSIGEPILQDTSLQLIALQKFMAANPYDPQAEFLRLKHRLQAAQFPSTVDATLANPLTNFTERDLVEMAKEIGFSKIHMELHMDARPSLATEWEVYLNTSPHPLAPAPREILAKLFSEAERKTFEQYMRPTIEAGRSSSTDVFAYLTAEKPTRV